MNYPFMNAMIAHPHMWVFVSVVVFIAGMEIAVDIMHRRRIREFLRERRAAADRACERACEAAEHRQHKTTTIR